VIRSPVLDTRPASAMFSDSAAVLTIFATK
jgi:hypothetical protein